MITLHWSALWAGLGVAFVAGFMIACSYVKAEMKDRPMCSDIMDKDKS